MADLELDHSGLQEVANAMRQDAGLANAQKRKRESDSEIGRMNKRVSPTTANMDAAAANQQLEALQDYDNLHDQNGNSDHANASNTATAALALYPAISIPARTEDTFATQGSDGERTGESFINENSQQGGDQNFLEASTHSTSSARIGAKPPVGSEEWHKVRKDNHKEVERRRRETINEGINELAKIVPGCEKNKGSILQRAVSFIIQLKDNETQNIEKWTLEKLLTEQAIAELSASNDKLKAENERAWREVETWKKTCQSAGLAPKKDNAAGEE